MWCTKSELSWEAWIATISAITKDCNFSIKWAQSLQSYSHAQSDGKKGLYFPYSCLVNVKWEISACKMKLPNSGIQSCVQIQIWHAHFSSVRSLQSGLRHEAAHLCCVKFNLASNEEIIWRKYNKIINSAMQVKILYHSHFCRGWMNMAVHF